MLMFATVTAYLTAISAPGENMDTDLFVLKHSRLCVVSTFSVRTDLQPVTRKVCLENVAKQIQFNSIDWPVTQLVPLHKTVKFC